MRKMIRKYLKPAIIGGLLVCSGYLLLWNVMNYLYWYLRLDDNWGLLIGVVGTPILSALMINEVYSFYKKGRRI